MDRAKEWLGEQGQIFAQARYVDYDGERVVKNKFDAFVRTFRHLRREKERERKRQRREIYTPIHQLAASSAAIETMFYIPNRFRQIVTLNTKTVVYKEVDAALLDLIQLLFCIESNNLGEGILAQTRYIFKAYKLFLVSTLPYETMSMCLRMKTFEFLTEGNKSQPFIQTGSYLLNQLLAGFISGGLVAYLTNPLFKLNIHNHNYTYSKLPMRSFLKDSRGPSLPQFLFSPSALVLFRGGLLGLFQQSLYSVLLRVIESEDQLRVFKKSVDSSSVEAFIFSVRDNKEEGALLERLAALGYFQNDSQQLEKVHGKLFEYRSILSASLITSFLIAVVMTPVDYVAFNVAQERFVKRKGEAKVLEMIREVRKRPGISNAYLMMAASNFVRSVFVLTSLNCADNYFKMKQISE